MILQLYTSQAPSKPSWRWKHYRKNVFILELDPVEVLKRRMLGQPDQVQIARFPQALVKRVLYEAHGLYVGQGERNQYAKALAKARELMATLQKEGSHEHE